MPIQPVVTTSTTTETKETTETKVVRPISEHPEITNRTFTKTTTEVREPSPYPNDVPSIVTKELKTFMQEVTKSTKKQEPVISNISDMVVSTKRILRKITKEDEKPIDKESEAPEGYVYSSTLEKNETTNEYQMIRRLRPKEDHPEPMEGEPDLPAGCIYETVEDKKNVEYNVDGEKILKFIRRIVRLNSTTPEKDEKPAPEGYRW